MTISTQQLIKWTAKNGETCFLRFLNNFVVSGLKLELRLNLKKKIEKVF